MLISETGEMYFNGAEAGDSSATGYPTAWALGTLTVTDGTITGPIPQNVQINSVLGWWSVASARADPAFGAIGGTIIGQSLSLNGLNWTFNPVYNEPSSLPLVAGTWTPPSDMFGPIDTTSTVSISSSGAIYAQDLSSGSTCVVNGQISPVDPSYNAYNVTMAYDNCASANWPSEVDGLVGTGLAYLDNSVSPAQLQIGVYFPNAAAGNFIGVYTLTQ
jgi:hypothetical protein